MRSCLNCGSKTSGVSKFCNRPACCVARKKFKREYQARYREANRERIRKRDRDRSRKRRQRRRYKAVKPNGWRCRECGGHLEGANRFFHPQCHKVALNRDGRMDGDWKFISGEF